MHRPTVILMLMIPATLSGCAAVTNPVANGVPVRMLPAELLAESREALVEVNFAQLQRPRETHRIGPGDILGIYVENVTGPPNQPPPLQFPEGDLPPALGYPYHVREDGTLFLPIIDSPEVEGLTLIEAEELLARLYIEGEYATPDARVLVSLIRPRTVRVLVIRQDTPNTSNFNFNNIVTRRFRGFGGINVTPSARRGVGLEVHLATYENDVMSALALTGGLPGVDAVNEVVIYRGAYRSDEEPDLAAVEETETVHIPLRVHPDAPLPFTPEDVILNDGDVVYIAGRESEIYHTGGLLPTAELPLPRDFDVDVLEAVARVNGPLINGGINSNNLSGSIVGGGVGNPSPSQLTVRRKTEDGRVISIRVDLNRALVDQRENILIQANDFLILQETPGEALARYLSQRFGFNFSYLLWQSSRSAGAVNGALP